MQRGAVQHFSRVKYTIFLHLRSKVRSTIVINIVTTGQLTAPSAAMFYFPPGDVSRVVTRELELVTILFDGSTSGG